MIEFIVEEGGGTRRVELTSVPVHIGRAEEADISLVNDRCSRHHARLQLEGRDLILMDLDSSNGTFRDGERVRRVRLSRGDRIEIGDAILTYVGGDAPVPPTATPHPEIPGYTILDEQGEGVLSHVLMARQDALGRKVAIKVLREEWRGSKAIVTRFLRQARQQSRLHHHGLASGIDVGEVGSIPYYVLEYLEGDTIGARVRSALAFDPDAALVVLRELLEVVGWIHEQGQCLENLHPDGVVLGDQGEVWVTSLGFPLPSPRSVPDGFSPELAYLAPEAVTEPSDAGPRGDVFSVGAIAAFMLTGRSPRPHGYDTPSMLADAAQPVPPELLDGRKLPPAVKRWVSRLLSTDPGDRPADGNAALAELEALMGDLESGQARLMRSAQAAEERMADGPVSFRRSKRFILVNRIITVCIGVALNVGFFLWWTGRGKNEDDGKPERPAIVHEEAGRPGDGGPIGDGGGTPVGNRGGGIDDGIARQEFGSLERSVRKLLTKDQFSEAMVITTAFVERHAGSPWAQKGLELVNQVQAQRLTRAGQVLDELETRINAGELSAARTILSRARGLAADVAADRLEGLETRLREARAKNNRDAALSKPKPSGGSGDDRGAGTAPKPADPGAENSGPAHPKPQTSDPYAPSRWPELVERALTRPSQQELRTRLLELAAKASPDQLGKLAPRVRWMRAVDRGLADVRAAWRNAVGQDVEVPIRGQDPVMGRLKSVEDDRLVLESGDATVDVSLDRVSPDAMARMLSMLPPSLDRYLTLAGLHIAARDGEEAWFDLQGALILATDDALAREVAEMELERLRRSPPRRRKN